MIDHRPPWSQIRPRRRGTGDPRDGVLTSAVRRAIVRSAELGADLVDTAEVYGRGTPKEVVGRRSGRSAGTASSCHEGRGYHMRERDVERACRGSLRRLGVRTIDLYQVTWPDPWDQVPFKRGSGPRAPVEAGDDPPRSGGATSRCGPEGRAVPPLAGGDRLEPGGGTTSSSGRSRRRSSRTAAGKDRDPRVEPARPGRPRGHVLAAESRRTGIRKQNDLFSNHNLKEAEKVLRVLAGDREGPGEDGRGGRPRMAREGPARGPDPGGEAPRPGGGERGGGEIRLTRDELRKDRGREPAGPADTF